MIDVEQEVVEVEKSPGLEEPITSYRLHRQYEKYLKRIEVRPKLVREMFTKDNGVCYLVKPEPDRYMHPPYPSFGMRYTRLSVDKQLEFIRGHNDNDLDETTKLAAKLIETDNNMLIKRKRNRAVLFRCDDTLSYVYCRGDRLRRLDLLLSKDKLSLLNQSEFESTNGRIYEVQQYLHHIIVRNLYRLKLFTEEGKPLQVFQENQEIVASTFNHFLNQELIVSTYHSQTTFKRYDVARKETVLDRFKYPGLARSVQLIKKAALIFPGEKTIFSLDMQSNRRSILAQSSERLLELQWLRSPCGNTDFFGTIGRSRIEFYDIRRADKPLASIKHYSEETPPDILQYFVGNPRSNNFSDMASRPCFKPDEPFVVAHSPYKQSNCLALSFGHGEKTVSKQSYMGSLLSKQCSNRGDCSAPMLLFDSGKLFKEAKPISITPIMLSNNKLGFIQSDNCGGVSLQAFQLDPSSESRRVGLIPVPFEPRGKVELASQLPDSLNQARAFSIQRQKYVEPVQVKLEQGAHSVSKGKRLERNHTEQRKTLISNMTTLFHKLFEENHEEPEQRQPAPLDLPATMDTFASQNPLLAPEPTHSDMLSQAQLNSLLDF